MLGLMMGVAMVTMMVLPVGVMGDLAMGRIGVAEDPTTSGRSHLLQGAFLGVSILSRNQKSHEFLAFSA